MNNFAEAVGAAILVILLVFVVSVFGGTVLYFIWEDSLTAMFPKAVESGVLAAKLTWWQSVKIVWIFALLVKATQTNKNKE
jgi:hypothetical protein